jgi:hypothetical protein
LKALERGNVDIGAGFAGHAAGTGRRARAVAAQWPGISLSARVKADTKTPMSKYKVKLLCPMPRDPCSFSKNSYWKKCSLKTFEHFIQRHFWLNQNKF